VSVCVFVLSLLGNGCVKYIHPSVLCNDLLNTFRRQWLHEIIELLDAQFSTRSVFYQRRVYGSLYLTIVAREQLDNDVPAARKNCGGRHFLFGPYHIKWKQTISSSKNFFVIVTCYWYMHHVCVSFVLCDSLLWCICVKIFKNFGK
jgi:hypothetical protein